VFDAASSTVQARTVMVATADGNEVVIADGLKSGEQVVVAGVHVLAPNQKVTLYRDKNDKKSNESNESNKSSLALDNKEKLAIKDESSLAGQSTVAATAKGQP
jgi:hypothetical protein